VELTKLEENLISRLRQDEGYVNDIHIEVGDLALSESIKVCDHCGGLTRHECFTWTGEEEDSCYCNECRRPN